MRDMIVTTELSAKQKSLLLFSKTRKVIHGSFSIKRFPYTSSVSNAELFSEKWLTCPVTVMSSDRYDMPQSISSTLTVPKSILFSISISTTKSSSTKSSYTSCSCSALGQRSDMLG